MLNYYSFFKDDKGYIYSCDMIRLNFELKNDNLDELDKIFNRYSIVPGFDIKTYFNHNGIGYHYLYKISIVYNDKTCSFCIGAQLNCLTVNKNRGFIEFNPNKCCDIPNFNYFYNDLVNICISMKLVRYDCAIDLPIKRSNVKLISNLRCNFRSLTKFEEEGQILNRTTTEYQGRRNCNKFTKLYDKTVESKLNYDLTRIEFTFDADEILFNNLPNFFIYDINIVNQHDLYELSANELVLVDLLRNSEDINYYLNNLGYRKRKKIFNYLYDELFYAKDKDLLKVREIAKQFEF